MLSSEAVRTKAFLGRPSRSPSHSHTEMIGEELTCLRGGCEEGMERKSDRPEKREKRRGEGGQREREERETTKSLFASEREGETKSSLLCETGREV